MKTKIENMKKTKLGRILCAVLGDEKGAVMMEYVIIALLIATAAVAAVGFFGETITGAFNTMIVAIFGQDKEAQEKFKEQHDLQETRVESATSHNAVIRNKSSDSSEE